MSVRAGLSGVRPPVQNSHVTSSTPLNYAHGQADPEWSLPELSGSRVKNLMRAHAGGRQPDSTPLSGSDVPPRRLDDDFEGVEEKYAYAEVGDGVARDKRVQQPLHPYQQANIPADNTRLSGTSSTQAYDVLKEQIAELRREQMEMKGVLPGGSGSTNYSSSSPRRAIGHQFYPLGAQWSSRC